MRINRGITNRLRSILGMSLSIFALFEVERSVAVAEIHYNGGYVQVRRSKDPIVPSPMPLGKVGTPPAPSVKSSSYSPDNDFDSSRFSPTREPQSPDSANVNRLTTEITAESFPWNRMDFEDYREAIRVPADTSLFKPKKYSLEIATLRPQPRTARTESAGLIAHLPEHALLWVEDTRTRLTGRTRIFQSPPLKPERNYNYRVRAIWIEDGHWVSQTQMVPVQAGRIEAVYLQRRPH